MKCSLCGHEVSANERFCRNCGENNEHYVSNETPKVANQPIQQVPINPNYAQPIIIHQAPVYKAPSPSTGESLGLGICSIVFGSTFYLSFVGLILAIAGLSNYRGKPGRILSRIGFGISLGCTCLLTLYVFIWLIILWSY